MEPRVINLGWEAIRDRPGMFLTPVSVCSLRHFIRGYEMGRVGTNSPSQFTLPHDFHDWVAYRLHFYGSTQGWANMIIERLGDGPHAVDRFFTLLDEYQARVPRVVAMFSGCKKTYTQYHLNEEQTRSYPSKIMLTAYNSEDPGLFVSADGEEHFPGAGLCPSLKWFEMTFGRCRKKLRVFNQAAIDRWASAEAEGD